MGADEPELGPHANWDIAVREELVEVLDTHMRLDTLGDAERVADALIDSPGLLRALARVSALGDTEPIDDDLTAMLELYVPGATMPQVRRIIRRLLRGERAPQCRATWPEHPIDGYAACQARQGHRELHVRPDGARWADGGPLIPESPPDEEAEEAARFWLLDQVCDSDPAHAEHAARLLGELRRAALANPHGSGSVSSPLGIEAGQNGNVGEPSAWEREMRAMLGKRVTVRLSGEGEPLTEVTGVLRWFDDGGEVHLRDDEGTNRWCWPAIAVDLADDPALSRPSEGRPTNG